jgi:nitric oxide reductase subunit B
MSLAPIGILQVHASVTQGFWYARSAEFLHSPLIEGLVWLRVPGDIIFGAGCLTIAWFVLTLWRKRGVSASAPSGEGVTAR